MDEYSDLESLCQDMKYENIIKYKFSFERPPYKYEYEGILNTTMYKVMK